MSTQNEKPILMSTPMVRAILEGRKSMTRRAMKQQPHEGVDSVEWQNCIITGCNTPDQSGFAMMRDGVIESESIRCPYGATGDRLWVRETFAQVDWLNKEGSLTKKVLYRSDGQTSKTWRPEEGDKWRPSIYMPRWASRITLEITGVRVERLQDITEADAQSEGIQRENDVFSLNYKDDIFRCVTAKEVFSQLWSKINGADSWDANPWVWVVMFRRV